MSCTDAGYGSSLPERKSSATETTPCDAMYSWRTFLREAIALAPRAAVALDQRRERTWTLRRVDARQQRLVAVAEILDFLNVEVLGFGIHGAILRFLEFRAIRRQEQQPEAHDSAIRRDIGERCFWRFKMRSVPANQQRPEEAPCVR